MSGHYGKLVRILIVTKGVGLFLGVCLFYGMVYGVGEISLLLIALKSLQIDQSRFFSACSTAFNTCKTILIYSNAKGNDF